MTECVAAATSSCAAAAGWIAGRGQAQAFAGFHCVAFARQIFLDSRALLLTDY